MRPHLSPAPVAKRRAEKLTAGLKPACVMTLNRLAAAFFAASTSPLDQSGVMGNAFALKPLKSREHPAMRPV
jgi:hypothetical protein